MYTAGIHAGIQTAHAVHDMMLKYMDGDPARPKFINMMNWVRSGKTIIVKQAGYHSHLEALYRELTEFSAYLDLPIVKWKESKDALNGATTAVGIVVPSYIYKGEFAADDAAEASLKSIIDRYPMAI